MTITEAISDAETKLKAANVPSARLDAELLLQHTLGSDKTYLVAHNDQPLSTSQLKQFETYLARRIEREPVCYITNQLEFYGLPFYVDNRVLAPRVETELVAEQAIKNAPKGSSLIDLGTGSGAIAVTIAKHRPDLTITATEEVGS